MEGNTNWESKEQGRESLTNNTNDWRSQLDPQLRENFLSKIMEKLKVFFPTHGENSITQIATKFEEKIYGIAKDKADYVRKIMDKMQLIENKCDMMKSSSSANVINTQDSGQSVPTSLPQTPTSQQWLPQQLFPGSQRQHLLPQQQPQMNQHMQQQAQPQPQQHMQSLLKQSIHQSFPQSSTVSSLSSSGNQNSQFLLRHQYPTQRVHSRHQQQIVLPLKDKMNVPSTQQNHLTSRHNIGEKQGAFMPSYQALTPHNNLQTMHQQQFNSTGVLPSQQQQTMPRSQSASQDSIGRTVNGSGGDWQEKTYQRIKVLKEKYSLILNTMLESLKKKLRQAGSLPPKKMQSGLIGKLKGMKSVVEEVLVFLNSHRSNISEKHRDMFSKFEEQIFRITKNHTAIPRTMQQQQGESQQPQRGNRQLQMPVLQQGVNKSSNQCQLLKAVASPAILSNIHPSASSSQLVDQQILPAVVNKIGTPSESGGSPFVVSFPVTCFVPPEKPMTLESPVSHSQSPCSLGVEIKSTLAIKPITQEQPLVSLSPEPVAERAIHPLIKAIQSSSQRSLAESVSEMSLVTSMADRFAGSCQYVGGSIGGLGEDLSARTNFRLRSRNLMTHGETSPNKRMKRSINALPLENRLESQVDSTTSYVSRVNKIESDCVLMEEIKKINRKLVETVVKMCDDDVYRSEVRSGTIVMCSYVPVALCATFKAHYNSGQISQIQPLRLLVPTSYPNCSPTLLEEIPMNDNSDNYEDLYARTRSRFSLSLKELSEPVSLKQMAQAWNDCARATMVEYATRHGGGTFSSKYGAWETVLRAS